MNIFRVIGNALLPLVRSWSVARGSDRMFKYLWAYLRVRLGLAKYALLEYLCYAFLLFLGGFSVLGLLFYAVGFASIALALYLNVLFSSAYGGYVVVSLLYVFCTAGVFFLFRSKFFQVWIWRMVERLMFGEDKIKE